MRSSFVLSLIAAALLATPAARPQEHPKEHPSEHPKKGDERAQEITTDALAQGIEGYIQKEAKMKGGYFLIFDTVDKKPLVLTLEKVHRDKLASLGNGMYFACTDMKNTDGVVYDLDFFMADVEGGLQPSEVSIHKKAGKPRYGWKEEGGTWKKVEP
jgi:hypothetical protein